METNRCEKCKAVIVVIKQENPPREIPSVESKQNQSCYWDRRESPLWKAKLLDENPTLHRWRDTRKTNYGKTHTGTVIMIGEDALGGKTETRAAVRFR